MANPRGSIYLIRGPSVGLRFQSQYTTVLAKTTNKKFGLIKKYYAILILFIVPFKIVNNYCLFLGFTVVIPFTIVRKNVFKY